MNKYEVLQEADHEEGSPLYGSLIGDIVEMAESPGILSLIEQGIIKLIESFEGKKAEVPVTAAEPISAATEPAEIIAPQTNAPTVPTPPTAAQQATASLQAKFPLPPSPFQTVKPMLYAFCIAIMDHEVYSAPGENAQWPNGTRSYFDCNPGNLKFRNQTESIGSDKDGFAMFPVYEAGPRYYYGFMALVNQVTLAASGKSAVYKNPVWDPVKKIWRPMNFLDYFAIYDSSHGDDPVAYAKDVAASMKVPVETTINQLIA